MGDRKKQPTFKKASTIPGGSEPNYNLEEPVVNRILDTYMNKIPSRILDVALRGIQQVYRLAGYR
jgi:hypothetical protein